MPITEFAILRNRTTEMVRFTYGGQTQEVKPGDTWPVADLGMTVSSTARVTPGRSTENGASDANVSPK